MRLIRLQRIVLAIFVSWCCVPLHSQTTSIPNPSPAVVTPPSAKENFHLYLLMGQSNMAGRDRRTLDSQVDNPHVLALNNDGQWIVARDPIHNRDGRTEPGAGPGIPFALAMVKTDPKVTVGLIPCAVGGSPLKRWRKGGDLYERALDRAKTAAQSGVIKGMLWHQGEADTTKQEVAESYGARLVQMFTDLRQDLNKPGLPIVVGQLGGFLSPTKYPYAPVVVGAIKEVPTKIAHAGYADSVGLTDKGDQLHFDDASQKELGTRYAVAMQQLQK